MRFFRILGLFLFVVAAVITALGKENKLGIREVNRISFDAPVHIGSVLVPKGDYLIRHIMEGSDHVMVFTNSASKQEFKTKCSLVALPNKVQHTSAVYELNASQEKVLTELRFEGDTAKHVF